jgi:hypothetical protein
MASQNCAAVLSAVQRCTTFDTQERVDWLRVQGLKLLSAFGGKADIDASEAPAAAAAAGHAATAANPAEKEIGRLVAASSSGLLPPAAAFGFNEPRLCPLSCTTGGCPGAASTRATGD